MLGPFCGRFLRRLLAEVSQDVVIVGEGFRDLVAGLRQALILTFTVPTCVRVSKVLALDVDLQAGL